MVKIELFGNVIGKKVAAFSAVSVLLFTLFFVNTGTLRDSSNPDNIMITYGGDVFRVKWDYDRQNTEEFAELTSFNDNITATRICSQSERKSHIRNICKKPRMDTNHKVVFLVDDKHRMAYCFIPKIASSTWKIIMMTSTSKGRRMRTPHGAHHPGSIRERGLRISGLTDRIRKYTKFMIMRNPIDRFQSAYYDKMARKFTKNDPHFAYLLYARNTVLRATHSKRNGIRPTVKFKDFVNFVVNSHGYSRVKEDKHWARYASRCDPCRIRYDYLLRTETMDQDALLVLPLLNRNQSALSTSQKNVIGAHYANETSNIHEDIEIKKIGVKTLSLLNEISLSAKTKLKRRYAKELALFGYGFDKTTNTISCAIRGEDNSVCC